MNNDEEQASGAKPAESLEQSTRRGANDVRLLKPLDDLWAAALPILRKAVGVPRFHTWIQPCHLLEIAGNEATIGVPNQFGSDYVGHHLLPLLMSALTEVANIEIKTIKIVIDKSLSPS